DHNVLRRDSVDHNVLRLDSVDHNVLRLDSVDHNIPRLSLTFLQGTVPGIMEERNTNNGKISSK
ncbi:hypothetical protein BgiBS90_032887, partial [Biomphalaria glabrata]